MKRLFLFVSAFALSASAVLAGGSDDALSLVPPGAASVGVIRLDELRGSPLAARIFEDTDRMTVDGDAARFLEETGLRPKQDVDVVVVAATPAGSGHGQGETSALVMFEGRFDPPRLSAAVASRGGVMKTTPHAGYYLLDSEHHRGSPGAVAFASPRLVIAGDEPSVVAALSRRASGGSGFLDGRGLGRHLFRVNTGASAWALVDAARYPLGRRFHGRPGERDGDPAAALSGAMKSVSLLAFQATSRRDSLDLQVTGLSGDEETRELLADALRGVVAMWRLSVQEKSPEMVTVLRRFKIKTDDEGVTVSGTLPGSFLRYLTERSKHGRKAAR